MTISPPGAFAERITVIRHTIGDQCIRLCPVGSRVTCDPAPADTDEDWLALVSSDVAAVLTDQGFKQDGSPEFYTGNDNGGFRSWRRDELNIITTESSEFFDLFRTATYLAKRFNLLRKAERITLCQAVLYGVGTENLQPAPCQAAKGGAA